MNNTINQGVSFKANLVTPYKTDVMQKVSKEFSQITKKTNGDLFLKIGSGEDRLTGAKEFVFKDAILATAEVNKYLNKSIKDMSDEKIKELAQKFADVLEVLKAEADVNRKINHFEDEISVMRAESRRCIHEKAKAEKFGLQGLAEIWDENLKKSDAKIEAKRAKFNKTLPNLRKSFLEKIEKFKDHEFIEGYVAVAKDGDLIVPSEL